MKFSLSVQQRILFSSSLNNYMGCLLPPVYIWALTVHDDGHHDSTLKWSQNILTTLWSLAAVQRTEPHNPAARRDSGCCCRCCSDLPRMLYRGRLVMSKDDCILRWMHLSMFKSRVSSDSCQSAYPASLTTLPWLNVNGDDVKELFWFIVRSTSGCQQLNIPTHLLLHCGMIALAPLIVHKQNKSSAFLLFTCVSVHSNSSQAEWVHTTVLSVVVKPGLHKTGDYTHACWFFGSASSSLHLWGGSIVEEMVKSLYLHLWVFTLAPALQPQYCFFSSASRPMACLSKRSMNNTPFSSSHFTCNH